VGHEATNHSTTMFVLPSFTPQMPRCHLPGYEIDEVCGEFGMARAKPRGCPAVGEGEALVT
jgi:hypothetical protein